MVPAVVHPKKAAPSTCAIRSQVIPTCADAVTEPMDGNVVRKMEMQTNFISLRPCR